MALVTHPANPCDTFQFWHGAQKWGGRPEIRPSRAKSYEDGPGFYLTNQLDTAKKYAKGAGCLIEVHLSAQTRWLQGHRLPIEAMLEFLDSCHRLRGRPRIVEGLEHAAQREQRTDLSTASLVNLCVNEDALTGSHGPSLAAWLVKHGVDATHEPHGAESRVVLFNPNVVTHIQMHRVATVDPLADFPDFVTQQARLLSQAHSLISSPRRRASP